MPRISSFVASSDASTTASNTGVIIPATATYCTLMVAMRGADGGATTLISGIGNTELDGVAFTLDNSTLRQFNGFQAIECGYMLDAAITSGTVTLLVTRTTGTDGMIAIVTFFDDVVQNAPLVALNGYDSSPPDPVTTSVTTTATNSVIVDMICTSVDGTFTVQETNQTLRENLNLVGASLEAWSSTRAVTSSGSIAMSWDTASNSNRTTHILLGLEEAAASATVDDINTTEIVLENEQDVTFTTSDFAGEITSFKLVSGSFETSLTGISSSGGAGDADIPDFTSYDGVASSPIITTTNNAIVAELSDGTDTAELAITVNARAGHEGIEVASAVKTEGSIYENVVEAVPDESIHYYATANNTAVSVTGILTTDATSNFSIWWWNSATGITKEIEVTVDAGAPPNTGSKSGNTGISIKLGISL